MAVIRRCETSQRRYSLETQWQHAILSGAYRRCFWYFILVQSMLPGHLLLFDYNCLVAAVGQYTHGMNLLGAEVAAILSAILEHVCLLSHNRTLNVTTSPDWSASSYRIITQWAHGGRWRSVTGPRGQEFFLIAFPTSHLWDLSWADVGLLSLFSEDL
jgi:hypothetical protein